MIYLTGDTHANFHRIADFCGRMQTTRDDVIIILGDAGVNFYGPRGDLDKKIFLAGLPVTLLCIHGNHEQRPCHFPSYRETPWRGGVVWAEEMFPSLLFARDGEVYDLDGAKCIAIGGAYSPNARYLVPGRSWWYDEQPTPTIREEVFRRLDAVHWQVDAVLSHTVPLKYIPREAFLAGIDQDDVDNSTEIWLDEIEDRLDYRKWYAGHFHISKRIDRLQLLYEDFTELQMP